MKSKKTLFCGVILGLVFIMPAAAQDFFKSVLDGKLAQVKLLLQKNPQLINQQSEDDEVSLHMAAQGGHMEIIKFLISKGQSVHSKNVSGETPLHYAAFFGFDEATSFLIEKGAVVDEGNHELYTPLHYAIFRGHLKVVEILLEKGANINAATHYDDTPLDFAQRSKFKDIAQFLISKGGKNTQVKDPEVVHLSKNIYRILFPYGRVSNIGVSAGEDGFLLVDTGFHVKALDKLGSALGKLGNGKIKYIINTHLHWDHTAGNAIAGEDTEVIQYKNLDQMVSRGILSLKQKNSDTPGDKNFKKQYGMEFNGEKIIIIPHPGIHTEDDIMVYFVKSGVVHVGDLLIPESFPSVRKEVDGYLEFLQRVIGFFPEGTKFICGHGHECSMNDVRKYRAMLYRAAEIIRKSIGEGKTKKQIRDSGVLREFDPWGKSIPELNVNYWMGAIFRNQ